MISGFRFKFWGLYSIFWNLEDGIFVFLGNFWVLMQADRDLSVLDPLKQSDPEQGLMKARDL